MFNYKVRLYTIFSYNKKTPQLRNVYTSSLIGFILSSTSFAVYPVKNPIGIDPSNKYGNIAAIAACL